MIEASGVNQDASVQILQESMVNAEKMCLKDVPVVVVAGSWWEK
jgi:hypothetical protein